jgi:hypothetical protein
MYIDLNEENNRNDYFENKQAILYSPNISYQDYFYRYFCDKSYLNDNIENRCIYETFNDNKNDAYNMTQFQDEKTTEYKSKKTIRKKRDNLEPLKILDNVKIKADSLPIFYSFDDIKNNIFENDDYRNNFSFDIDNIFIKDKKSEEPYLNKKRFRENDDEDNYYYDCIESEENKSCLQPNKVKRGRKPNNQDGRTGHNRMSPDNIIKKVKAELFRYMTLFLNNIINKSNLGENDNEIYKLDYRFINQLNREIDLKYLNMPLKDLFSLDISPKYRKLKPEANKIKLEKILNENQDEVIQFVLNMTFRDWLDIFSYKKKIKELLYEYNVFDYSDDIYSRIEKNLVGVDKLLNEIATNDNKYYFSNFTFYLYNYEIWFFTKKGRKSKKNRSSNFSE